MGNRGVLTYNQKVFGWDPRFARGSVLARHTSLGPLSVKEVVRQIQHRAARPEDFMGAWTPQARWRWLAMRDGGCR
jgi:hypothetical protein